MICKGRSWARGMRGIRPRISATRLRALSGSRNSSTYFMAMTCPLEGVRRFAFLHCLHFRLNLTELGEQRQRSLGFRFVDMAHGETDMHKHPLALVSGWLRS